MCWGEHLLGFLVYSQPYCPLGLFTVLSLMHVSLLSSMFEYMGVLLHENASLYHDETQEVGENSTYLFKTL